MDVPIGKELTETIEHGIFGGIDRIFHLLRVKYGYVPEGEMQCRAWANALEKVIPEYIEKKCELSNPLKNAMVVELIEELQKSLIDLPKMDSIEKIKETDGSKLVQEPQGV